MSNSLDPDDPLGLAGKVAIVTGGSGGLGKGIAARLAGSGAKLVICGRDEDKGEAFVRDLAHAGSEALFVAADVLVYDDMLRLVQRTVDRFGTIDILVASGGGSRYPAADDPRKAIGYFHELVAEDVCDLIAEAALAKINPARAVIAHMMARRSGSILFVTSEGGRMPTPMQTAISFYAGGIIAMTKVLAKELAPHGIRANTVAVSIVEGTPSFDYAFGRGSGGAGVYEKLRAKAPFGLAKPGDIADVAAFLVSDRARFITGTTVSPTGGLTFS